ncbi:hypothetical protein NBRC116591_16230 [Sessilibacter corallicola]|uniref:Uncharacterized protein n=1 Tax=Sessilibacter corallicola TaxID=2904075 RepID=A0ABQ0A8D5_9GAMM
MNPLLFNNEFDPVCRHDKVHFRGISPVIRNKKKDAPVSFEPRIPVLKAIYIKDANNKGSNIHHNEPKYEF